MYDARVIANEILQLAWKRGSDLTQLDVQKICYFLNGHHLIDHGEPMIKTEFEAWRHGPVQPVLYNSFKKFGDGPISDLATAFDPVKRITRPLPRVSRNSVRATIEVYFERYAKIPAHELVGMTHRRGTPWQITLQEAETSANIGMKIATLTIQNHFEGLRAA